MVSKHNQDDLTVKWFPERLNIIWLKPLINYFFLPLFVKVMPGNYVFNLGNVAFPSKKKQFLLMHNAFAVCTDPQVYNKFPLIEQIKQKLMNAFIRFNLRFADVVAVQTKNIQTKVEKITRKKPLIIPNVTAINAVFPSSYRILPTGQLRFLLLSKYYIHKNFEILIPLAKLIRQEKLPFEISVTLDHSNTLENRFLQLVKREGLMNIISNLGFVPTNSLSSVYHEHDALLLPTLMESYSGTYTEAMTFCKPILTSDRDFAREVCGEGAIYFDPLNANDILKKMKSAFSDIEQLQKSVETNLLSVHQNLNIHIGMANMILSSLK